MVIYFHQFPNPPWRRFELAFVNTLFYLDSIKAYYESMLVSFPLFAFLVNEYFTREWQGNVRDIICEVSLLT